MGRTVVVGRDCCDGERLLQWGETVLVGRAYHSRENVVVIGSMSQYSA